MRNALHSIQSLILITTMLLGVTALNAASRYWIASSSSNWNNTANWSTTTGGSGGASVPGSGDVAYFNGGPSNNKNGSCSIDASVNVAGLLMNGTYSGTITTSTQSVTIGSSTLTINSGTFTCGTGSIDINGTLGIAGGTFNAPAFFTLQNGLDFTSGTFNHNNGTVEFDGTASATIDVNSQATLFNVNVRKTSGYNVSIATGDTIIITNKLDLINGEWRNNYTKILDTLRVGSNFGYVNSNIKFTGSVASDFILSKGLNNAATMTILKTNKLNTVTLSTPLSYITEGSAGLSISRGTLNFSAVGNPIYDFNYSAITISSGGILSAPKYIRVQGNITNNGGRFIHNNGTVDFDGLGNKTIDMNVMDTFYNVKIDKDVTDRDLYIATGDTMYVINKLELINGDFRNNFVRVDDSVVVGTGMDASTITLKFTGAGTSHFICNKALNSNTTLTIFKSNKFAKVIYSGNAGGNIVEGKSTLNITRGTIEFEPGRDADFNYSSVNINPNGILKAPTKNLYISGNYYNNGGRFIHNNGTVWFDGTTVSTIDVQTMDTFYSVAVSKTNASSSANYVTVSAGDTIYAKNKIFADYGRFYGASAFLKTDDTLFISQNAYTTTNTNYIFTGAATGHYISDRPLNSNQLTLRKANKNTRVIISRTISGIMNDNVTSSLNIISGTLSFAPGLNADLDYPTITIQTNGRIIAPNGTLTLSGATWNNAGRFTHNNGTVIFDNNSNSTMNTNITDTFYNFTLNKQGTNNTATITTGDSIQVVNKLYLYYGKFAAGTLNVRDTLVVDPTFGTMTTTALTFTGTADGDLISDKSFNALSITVNKTTASTYLHISAAGSTFADASSSFTIVKGYVDFPSNNNLDLNFANFTINPSGRFKSTSGTVYMSGNYTNNGGRFIHNNSTWVFDGTNSTGFDANITDTFYNVTLNKPSTNDNLTIVAADTLMVLNTLNLTDGDIITGNIRAHGNVTSVNTFGTSSANILFGGNTNTNFDLTNVISSWNGNIQLKKKTAKTVTLLSSVQMDAVSQQLVLTKGFIANNSTNVLIIGDNNTVTGASDSSFVKGFLRKDGNDAFNFPVGGTKYLRPIIMTAPASTATQFTASYYLQNPNEVYNTLSKDASIDHLSKNEYWIFNRGGSTSTVFVTLTWNNKTSGQINDMAGLKVCRWDGTTWRNHGNGLTTGNSVAGTVISSAAITNFSPFTLGSGSSANPLPVQMISFTAKSKGNETELDWSTASEENNSHFEVEKSTNGIDFLAFGSVQGNGTTQKINNYSIIDHSSNIVTTYYRLKQVDFNGKFEYSKIISIKTTEKVETNTLKLYPNPSQGSNVQIIGNVEKAGINTTLNVIDGTGRTVYNSNMISDGNANVSMSLESLDLKPGMYYVQIQTNNSSATQRLIVK